MAPAKVRILHPRQGINIAEYLAGMSIWSSGNIPASLAQYDYVAGAEDYRVIVAEAIEIFRNTYPASFDKTQ